MEGDAAGGQGAREGVASIAVKRRIERRRSRVADRGFGSAFTVWGYAPLRDGWKITVRKRTYQKPFTQVVTIAWVGIILPFLSLYVMHNTIHYTQDSVTRAVSVGMPEERHPPERSPNEPRRYRSGDD